MKYTILVLETATDKQNKINLAFFIRSDKHVNLPLNSFLNIKKKTFINNIIMKNMVDNQNTLNHQINTQGIGQETS